MSAWCPVARAITARAAGCSPGTFPGRYSVRCPRRAGWWTCWRGQQVQGELKTQLQQVADLKVWNRWLERQLKAAHVEYANAYRPAHPDAPPSSDQGY